ncbi:MAG: hypothetical protein QXN73_05510, partial [Thermofilaceae archaeon]
MPISIWVEWPQPARSLMDALHADAVERMLEKLGVEYRGFLPNISWLGVGLKGGLRGAMVHRRAGEALPPEHARCRYRL